MFSDPLLVIAVLGCLVVLGVLGLGIGGFARGGEFNRRHGNRLMRYRIAAQAVAVALILLVIWLRRQGGG